MTIHHLNGETWLICGGRNFTDTVMFLDALSQIMLMRGCPSKVVHGACYDLRKNEMCGADRMAHDWAKRMAIPVVPCPADWAMHGKAAGPIRNSEMLEQNKPHVVIAFPGGNGTRDTVTKARAIQGVDVIEIKPQPEPAKGPAGEEGGR